MVAEYQMKPMVSKSQKPHVETHKSRPRFITICMKFQDIK